MTSHGPTCKRPSCRSPRSCVHPITETRNGRYLEDCTRCDGTGSIPHLHPMTGRTSLVRCSCVAGIAVRAFA